MEMEAFYGQYGAVAYTRKGFWQGNGCKERPAYCYYVISKSCKLCVWKYKSSQKRGCKYEQTLWTFNQSSEVHIHCCTSLSNKTHTEFIPAQAGPGMQWAVVSGMSLIWTQWQCVNNRLVSLAVS